MIGPIWGSIRLAVEQPAEAFESGEIHARRERRSDRDRRNPEQPLTDTHLIPGVAPRCERRLQGRPERCRPLLGKETSCPSLPCAVSVPNLITDRGFWVSCYGLLLNVRRLMYQSVIWPAVLRHEAGSLLARLDAEDRKRLADPLIDSMR